MGRGAPPGPAAETAMCNFRERTSCRAWSFRSLSDAREGEVSIVSASEATTHNGTAAARAVEAVKVYGEADL